MFRINGIRGLLGALTAALAASTAACGDGPASPGGPPTPQTTHTLSGVVIETTPNGPAPMEGAMVRHLEGRGSATTDSSGFYSIAGVPAGHVTVIATRDGYTVATRVLTVSADTRIDFELVRLPPPAQPPFLVSGLVYERTPAGQMPVDGVWVEDSTTHIASRTDGNGRYSFSVNPVEFPWHDGFVRLYVAKEGFHTYLGGALPLVGDRRIDIELVRR